VGKRRTWRKLHLGIDESTGESMVAEVTTNDFHDSEILPSLLEGIAGEMAQVSGDGAYDTFACHEAIAQRGAAATIPPRHDARPTLSMEYLTRPTPGTKSCNVLSRWIVRTGGKRAAITVGLLLKPLCFVSRSPLGGASDSRSFDNQAVELFLQCAALNRMIQVAKPDSYPVEA
jgi:hypothetical protein